MAEVISKVVESLESRGFSPLIEYLTDAAAHKKADALKRQGVEAKVTKRTVETESGLEWRFRVWAKKAATVQ